MFNYFLRVKMNFTHVFAHVSFNNTSKRYFTSSRDNVSTIRLHLSL